MPSHIEAARNAILCYIHETGNVDFVDGKMIFLQGSPEMTEENGIGIGRLSGSHRRVDRAEKSRRSHCDPIERVTRYAGWRS